MPTPTSAPLTFEQKIGVVMAVVTIGGFAIQQALQILDWMIMAFIATIKSRRSKHDLPGGISDADFKKSLMPTVGFLLGLIVVCWAKIGTLQFLPGFTPGWPDTLLTALVISAGTDAANTLLKFFGYVKDARKQPADVVVTIIPATVSVAHGTTFQFQARVDNGSSTVTWSVLHGNGGSIGPADGLYTAPAQAGGIFQVACTSASDSRRPGLATVTVT